MHFKKEKPAQGCPSSLPGQTFWMRSAKCARPGKHQKLHLCDTTYPRPQSISLLLSFHAPKDRVRKNYISIRGPFLNPVPSANRVLLFFTYTIKLICLFYCIGIKLMHRNKMTYYCTKRTIIFVNFMLVVATCVKKA